MDFQNENSLATHASLLERLKNLEDTESWQQFYASYRNLIFKFALRQGATPTEAEEVVQETVITVARNLPEFRYDPARCAFKTWLFNLTLWRIRDQVRKRRPEDTSIHRKPGETNRTGTFERIPDPAAAHLQASWEEEWRKDLFERALEKIRNTVPERQFQIYDLFVLQQWPAGKVAQTLGISLARVYVTRHRLQKLLNKRMRLLQNGSG